VKRPIVVGKLGVTGCKPYTETSEAPTAMTKSKKSAATPLSDLPALEAAVADFDRTGLLSAIAGLQLLPENAERIVRLEAFAHLVASGKSKRSRKVAPHTLSQLCNCGALQTIAHAEDPFDGVFCEEVLFHGGSYKVLPGITEHATFILKRINEAIFFHRDSFPDASFVRTATHLIHGTLALSDRMCRLAGVQRNPDLSTTDDGNIVVPDGKRLAGLKASVRLSHAALGDFLRSRGHPADCLAPLTVAADGLPRENELQISGVLSQRPLVAGSTDIIIASPSELLPALRNALIALAQDRGVEKELASRFGSATWQAVHEHLSYINCDAIPTVVPSWHDTPAIVHDGYFSLDTDKLTYCLLVSDSLEDYDRNDPFGLWKTPNLSTVVSDRLRRVMEDVYSQHPQINEVFALVLMQTVGRFATFGFDGPDVTGLAIGAGDLCTLCLLEGGKDLILWQFAKSKETIRRHAHITQTGVLDEYAVYRKSRYTYYASDDFRPNMIFMAPGGAGTLRREVYRERDWHGVQSYEPNQLIEVTCLHSPDVPVYVPSERLGTRLALLVESLPLAVWVTGPDGRVPRNQWSMYKEYVDALAYWIWQFESAIRPALQYYSGAHKSLRVIVQLDWEGDPVESTEDTSNTRAGEKLVASEVLVDQGIVILRLSYGIEGLLSGADNAGERLFIREVLLAIRSLAPLHLSRELRDVSLGPTLDRLAPLGLKKKIFYLDLAQMPQLDQRRLPRPRHVQEVDKNALLDPIGEHFREDQHFEVGPIEPARVPKVINDIVKFCYDEFTAIVTSLSPDGLLEWLVARHESNVSSTASSRLTMATRIACFGQSPEFIREASRGLSDAAEAAVAGRFLIEYVSAQPPSGFRPMSLSVYDALLARAAVIAGYGMVSDIVHFNIAKIEVAMLGSGRLGFSPDQYRAAMDDYGKRFAASQVASAGERFRQNWDRPNEVDEAWRGQVEQATRAEFGFPLSTFLELLTIAIEMGLQNPPIVRMKYEDAVAQFAQRAGWDEQTVCTALEMFLSRPRKDFFPKENGFTREDVYPWRYGRRLSYLRRPFVAEESVDTWLIWGHRHVRDAQRYLLQTCFGGRLQAVSDEMKTLVSRHANREGEAFNDEVANRLEQPPGMLVRRRVKKVGSGGQAIQPPGDIDVLVFNTLTRTIYVLECKNLAFARTPFELASEIRALTESAPHHKSIIRKHQRRVQWVGENLAAILAWAGLDGGEPWTVRSAVVVDEPVMSPKLRDLGEPVFGFTDLSDDASDLGLDALCTVVFTPFRVFDAAGY
jgi:hypothetical protein